MPSYLYFSSIVSLAIGASPESRLIQSLADLGIALNGALLAHILTYLSAAPDPMIHIAYSMITGRYFNGWAEPNRLVPSNTLLVIDSLNTCSTALVYRCRVT